jgi:hypothetical protein
MTQENRLEKPIFILGIMHRSGTNFLHDLLCLHPDCVDGGLIKEDFLVAYSHMLVKYAKSVSSRWNPRWQVSEKIGPPDILVQFLGDGLLRYLNLQLDIQKNNTTDLPSKNTAEPDQVTATKRLVTKTPSVENLHNFHRLFPDAKLIVIVRDGRAVVESGVRSFNWKYERSTQRWKKRAETIMAYANSTDQERFLLVRYEDLVRQPQEQMKRVLTFVELDDVAYDYNATTNLPIKGSSDLRKQDGQSMHWKPVERPVDFDPLARFKHWGKARHTRFNWVAGKQLDQFGYDRISDAQRLYWLFPNLAGDLAWQFRKAADLTGQILKRARQYPKN